MSRGKWQRIHGDPQRDYAREWRRWRKAHGWTQAEMASVLWISTRTVLNIENGYHRPSVSSRTKLDELKKKYQEERNWQQQNTEYLKVGAMRHSIRPLA